MIYSRCKCGARESWDSGMPPARCSPCEKCGTVPATGANSHPDPVPHEYYESAVETDAGMQPLTVCRLCHRKKSQIEKADASRAHG